MLRMTIWAKHGSKLVAPSGSLASFFFSHTSGILLIVWTVAFALWSVVRILCIYRHAFLIMWLMHALLLTAGFITHIWLVINTFKLSVKVSLSGMYWLAFGVMCESASHISIQGKKKLGQLFFLSVLILLSNLTWYLSSSNFLCIKGSGTCLYCYLFQP